MQCPRLYSAEPLRSGTTLTLPPAVASHATRVLRLTAGDAITLFDGSGMEYAAVIRVAARAGLMVDIGVGRLVQRESALRITLFQGISRGPRMDTVVQKATELGVAVVQPILADRSVVRLDRERRESRVEHWRRIVISACEQCGRAVLPEVRDPCGLEAGIASLPPGTAGLTLHPGSSRRLPGIPADISSVALAIGPEGGFTATEVAILEQAGFAGVSLGPRILRTETAPLAALAILQFARGDLG